MDNAKLALKIRRLAQVERDLEKATKEFQERQQAFLGMLRDDAILDETTDIADQAATQVQAALDAQKNVNKLGMEHAQLFNEIVLGEPQEETVDEEEN